MNAKQAQKAEPFRGAPDPECGEPGGGKGRTDPIDRTGGVYPGSGPWPQGEAEIRTPGTLARGQTDEEGHEVEGGSEPIYYNQEVLLGGATPPPGGTPAAEAEGPAQGQAKP